MLSLPVVKNEGKLDTTGLQKYLIDQKLYSEDLIKNDISQFEKLRVDSCNIYDPSDSTQKLLLHYHHQLSSICPRISNTESEIKISFSWSDAFSHFKKFSSSNFYFEWACCLWNLAAYESLLGSRVDRQSEDGIKMASKHFQQASGFIEFLKNKVHPKLRGVTLPCFSEDGLEMAKNLMLAQSQLCFYEKAVRDKKRNSMKPGIIAKLAIQCAEFYFQCSLRCKVGSISSYLDISWYSITEFQSNCLNGAAEYWQALASKELALEKGSGYGEEVTRYSKAEQFLSAAMATAKKYNVTSAFTSGAEALMQAIQSNKKTSQHDLNTVYMESPPDYSSLQKITPVAMVKPGQVPELHDIDNLLFKFLLPKDIIESNRKFYESINSIYAQSSTDSENATNSCRTILSSVGLPGSIEAERSETPLPENLWLKIQKVQSLGGRQRLDSIAEDIKLSSSRASSTIQNIEDSICREEKSDDEFRKLYPEYSGTRSSLINTDIKLSNQRMKEALFTAQENDRKVMEELQSEDTKTLLLLVEMSKDELRQKMPSLEENLSSKSDRESGTYFSDLKHLEDKLQNLASLLDTRIKLVDDLKKLTNLDLMPHIMKAFSLGEDVNHLQTQYIDQAKTLSTKISDSIQSQEASLNEVLELNESFTKSRMNNPVQVKRNKIIQEIEQASTKFFTLYSQLNAGVTFYSNLQSKLAKIQQSADDLSYTQQWQRQEYETMRSSQMMKSNQELLDHQMALKLANEMQQASLQQQQQQQSQQQQPSPLFPSQYQQQQQQQQYHQFSSSHMHQQSPNIQFQQPSNPSGIVYASDQAPNMSSSQAPPHLATNSALNFNSNFQSDTNGFDANSYPKYNPQFIPPDQNQASFNPPSAPTNTMSFVPSSSGNPTIPSSSTIPDTGYNAYPNLNNQSTGLPMSSNNNPNPPGYQYNMATYNINSNPQAQPQNNLPSGTSGATGAAGAPTDHERKISMLCEMGFSRDNVQFALQANQWNEEAALNSLLSSAQGAPTHTEQTKTKSSSGIFGKMWGKK